MTCGKNDDLLAAYLKYRFTMLIEQRQIPSYWESMNQSTS